MLALDDEILKIKILDIKSKQRFPIRGMVLLFVCVFLVSNRHLTELFILFFIFFEGICANAKHQLMLERIRFTPIAT